MDKDGSDAMCLEDNREADYRKNIKEFLAHTTVTPPPSLFRFYQEQIQSIQATHPPYN